MAKHGSRSEPRLIRLGLFYALLLGLALPLAAQPITAAFANGTADARSVQPLRLSADLGGRERQVQLLLNLPPGARLARAITAFTAGGRVHVQILDVYVPATAGAGVFTVRGTVIDGTRRWPFEAAIYIRANPHLVVRDEDIGFTSISAEDTVRRTWRVTNNGNVLLTLRVSAQPAAGAILNVEPATLNLAPGESHEIVLTAKLDHVTDRLVTLPLFLNIDTGKDDSRRRETVGFTAEFIPLTAGTGPLFSPLTGEVLVGGFASEGTYGRAAQFRLDGEVFPGTQLLAYGTDGTPAPGGSHLGLATRDFFTAELTAPKWRATAGLVNPPSFGFLETSTQGRGATLAGFNDSGRTATMLAAREHYADFSREHAGIHVAQKDADQTGWETGLLAQRNQSGPSPLQERLGGYAQTNWRWSAVTGSSQIAAAQNTGTQAAHVGFEQRLDYHTEDNRSSAGAFVQTAPPGFFLDGRSAELCDTSLILATGETGRINLHWSQAREQGLLRSYRQTESDAGLTPTDPEFIELITRTGSAVRTWSAGYGFNANDGRAQLAYSDADRTRDASLNPNPADSYHERAITTDWSRAFLKNQVLLTTTLSGGTEENTTQQSDFAEAAFTAGGAVRENLQLTAELRHTWHIGGDPNAGYRQPGTYGRLGLVWTPRLRWRVETGLDAYQFGDYAGRTRSYAVLEAPVTARVALATEVSHDNERTTVWLAARIRLDALMPWRPVRGALTGRIVETGRNTPVAGARLDLGGRAGLTDDEGRFTLPGRLPGSYPLTWNLPTGFLPGEDWPATVKIDAGKIQILELAAQHLATLRGTVTITRGEEIERPTGPVTATESGGQIFEAMAAAGDFTLLLAPGRYTVRYAGETSPGVSTQLTSTVEIGTLGATVELHLNAVEATRGLRRTFFRDDQAPAKPPVEP